MDSVLRFGGGVYGSALFVAVDGDGFQVELDALTGAWEIHFVFVLHTSVCKIAAATDDLAPGEELIHDSGANSGGAFVRKDEAVALFDTQSAVLGFILRKFPYYSNSVRSVNSVGRLKMSFFKNSG